jgi:hypothetical protein
MKPVLYVGNLNYSSWSLRPYLALRWAGIDFDLREVELDQPGYGGDGIAETAGADPDRARSRCCAWAIPASPIRWRSPSGRTRPACIRCIRPIPLARARVRVGGRRDALGLRRCAPRPVDEHPPALHRLRDLPDDTEREIQRLDRAVLRRCARNTLSAGASPVRLAHAGGCLLHSRGNPLSAPTASRCRRTPRAIATRCWRTRPSSNGKRALLAQPARAIQRAPTPTSCTPEAPTLV